jgi:uncharacterized protein
MEEDKQTQAYPVPIPDAQFPHGFWKDRVDLLQKVVLPYQWAALNDKIPGVERTGAIENFRIAAGISDGEFGGMTDTDVYKWIEAAAYLLAGHQDADLQSKVELVVDLIDRAQRPDGYLHTYFTVCAPDERWKNLQENHELYTAGHMIEAAVALHAATGNTRLLDVAKRVADNLVSVFGEAEDQLHGYPGHQEIELALVRLFDATGESRYLELAKFFLDARGAEPSYFDDEFEKRGRTHRSGPIRGYGRIYAQDHLPVRAQREAVGHAVRAVYMYCALVDVGTRTEDQKLLEASDGLWKSVVETKMYLTGGIGSTAEDGEAFGPPFDLPPDRAYTETCASVALVFWAHRMLHRRLDGRYSDVVERALYNGALPGMALDGKSFFYVNPLMVDPRVSGKRADTCRVQTLRQAWYGCACCPPNLARLVASISHYFYSSSETMACVHLYGASTARLQAGGGITLTQETDYPWSGDIRISIGRSAGSGPFTLAMRIPGWCKGAAIDINGEAVSVTDVVDAGYAKVERDWHDGDVVRLSLPMPGRLTFGTPSLRDASGLVAVERGPLVYCFEQIDNGSDLHALCIRPGALPEVKAFDPELNGGIIPIRVQGVRESVADRAMYAEQIPHSQPVWLAAIPYFAWANRGEGEMRVWLRREPAG